LYLCRAALATVNHGIQPQIEASLPFCALPFDYTRLAVRLCPHVASLTSTNTISKWRVFMNSKIFRWAVRIVAVVTLAVPTSVLAQAPVPEHLSGIINDYTPATGVGGPWELHGAWSLKLKGESGKADFSAVMTMEHDDYWVLANPTTPPATPTVDNPGARSPHTHRITMTDALVSYDPSVCPADSPATTVRFVVTGPANIAANGTSAPFQTKGGVTTLSTLQICISGGTEVAFSNVTLTFASNSPATGHFGTQGIHGVIGKLHDPERDDRHR
jgi:hypothetical protein